MILRPSAASIWSKCAGSHKLSASAPDWTEQADEDIEVREEGTACHWSAHQHALTGTRVAEGALAPNGVAITDEMHEAHDVYFDAIRQWGVSQAFFEVPVVARRIHTQCQGTADVGAYDPARRTIFVGDLKFGFRFVDVMWNPQLLCYGMGLQDFFGIESDLDLWFEFLICQPRSYHRDGPVRRWRVHATELRAHINILAMAAERALADDATCKVNPGCGRCGGRYHCETLRQSALGETDMVGAAVPHDLPFAAAETELRHLQHARSMLDARITGLESQVVHGMRTGQASLHYAMEANNPRRVWKDDASRATIINIAKLLGVEATKEVILTPAQAEKKLPPAFVAEHSHRPAGSMKLVPVEQSRMHRALRK